MNITRIQKQKKNNKKVKVEQNEWPRLAKNCEKKLNGMEFSHRMEKNFFSFNSFHEQRRKNSCYSLLFENDLFIQ